MIAQSRRIALAILCCVTIAQAATAQPEFQRLLYTGDPIPDIRGGTVTSQPGPPSIGADGGVVFEMRLPFSTPGVTTDNDECLFARASSQQPLRLIAREGVELPGQGGAVLGGFAPDPVINGNGEVVFIATLKQGVAGVTFANDSCIVRFNPAPGTLQVLAREGTDAPGAGSTDFGDIVAVFPRLNAAGEVAFVAPLQTGATDSGLWVAAPNGGPLALLHRAGGPISGGGSFGGFFSTGARMHLGNLGAMAFLSGTQQGTAVFSRTGGTPPGASRPVAVIYNTVAPGMGGARYASVNIPSCNDAADIAFCGAVDISNGDINEALWGSIGGAVQLVAREGSQASGAAPAVFNQFTGVVPTINATGDISFTAWLRNNPSGEGGVTFENLSGLWTTRERAAAGSGSLRLVARQGQPAPGVPGGLFGGFFTRRVMNAAGNILFTADANVAASGGVVQGIWLYRSASDELVPVILEGEEFDVNPDPAVTTVRTVLSFDIGGIGSGLQDGSSAAFNDSGQLAISLFLQAPTGIESGLFVLNVADAICIADFNRDGTVSLQDLFDFISAYFEGRPAADVNGSSSVTLQDIFDFLSVWFAGC